MKAEEIRTDANVRIELPILLPDVEDERDQCVDRLQEQVLGHKGIHRVHIHREAGKVSLCLHYDANLLPLGRVRRIAEQAGAEVAKRYRHETLWVRDMDCADCALSIEHILSRHPGIINLSANYAAEKVWVEYDTEQLDPSGVLERIRALGYHVEREGEPKGWAAENWQLLVSLVAGILLGLGYAGETWLGFPRFLVIALYVSSYVAGGYDASRHGISAARNLRFDIDFLMVVAAVGAAALGQWVEGGLLLFLFSLGHALEHYAIGRARRSIEALGQVTPKTARVRRGGREQEIPVEALERGDHVIVRPGERVPIDGEVVEGRSRVDQSAITGESRPLLKDEGEAVFAGSLNGGNSLMIRVTKLAKETTLARVVRLVEEAQAQKSPTQRFTDRVSQYFVPSILALSVLVMVLPPLAGWLGWREAILRGITLLVAASPCALAIATPAAVLSGIAQAARNGVLIKGGVHLENLGDLRAIAFDKTGTITIGEPRVADLLPAPSISRERLLGLAATAESHSTHPLAQAILTKAQVEGLKLHSDVKGLEAMPGLGVRARLSDQTVVVGSPKYFQREAEDPIPSGILSDVERLEAQGKTAVLVQADSRYLGVIGVADWPRDEMRATLDDLRRLGIREFIMLTGDNERVAQAVAEAVGLTEYRADLLPDEKLDAVQSLMDRFGKVGMVGDGVNDAPALARSTVGIAMGAGGTDVALETADVALMADDMSKLPFAVGIGRRSAAIIRQNLLASLGIIALLIPLALSGLAGISIAILLHEGSTLLVVFNALRLLLYQGE
jgi:Cd2+/Zn2+-exporting ATPase